ncbi:MAG: DNA mismatch repair protein MutS [Oscillospiraceae bacterium]|nr:DNA mismatch repair protein MutS [Oscillospiraceae bacterium]
MAGLSPMMQQYMEIKEQHKDQLLFYRVGDFYEMFFDDALTASRELELVLTGKDCGLSERAPMCGVPHHSCEAYIARLVKKGYKVAICEQMEDPKQTKGIVRREVIRVYTPGTVIEAAMLDEGANNYISCVYCDENIGIVFADISTGRVYATEIAKNDIASLQNEISRFMPSEMIYDVGLCAIDGMESFLRDRIGCCAQMLDEDIFSDPDIALAASEQFGEELMKESGFLSMPEAVKAAGGLLYYLHQTQKVGVERLVSLEVYREQRCMMLDMNARRNLELVSTMRSGEKRGSLLWVIDRTRTAMGKRMLRHYLEQPLCNPVTIEKRHNAVEEIKNDTMLRLDLSEHLNGIYDMERLLTRIVCGTTTPRELVSLTTTIKKLHPLRERISGTKSAYLKDIFNDIDPMHDVADRISATLMDDPPALMKDGWYIRQGFSEELDELRSILTNTKQFLAQIETNERERTGIKSLKIGFNKVFGYYIEITNTYRDLVPDEYIRKQTLVNCERYITQELKTLEDKILSAHDRQLNLEQRIFDELRKYVSEQTERIQNTANAVARLDVFTGFANLAVENNYCRPQMTMNGTISIKDGRHPVVEEILGSSQRFVANDTFLDQNENRIAIITGPNMAGKSTYIRQVAVIVLLAQIGCFVPASSATIGVVDGIFTRVGASDDLATGQSTFMVEMNEVAQILQNATKNSLIILDEVGRGTSTFDGMSIARAMIEYIADTKKVGAKTLFATHYHELTELEQVLSCVKNYNTAVKKRGDDITFLRRIVRGAVDDSYGIEVSKLAGIPDWIIKRAKEILSDLDADRPISERRAAMKGGLGDDVQLSFAKPTPIDDAVRALDVDTLSPIEALNKLYEFKSMLNV